MHHIPVTIIVFVQHNMIATCESLSHIARFNRLLEPYHHWQKGQSVIVKRSAATASDHAKDARVSDGARGCQPRVVNRFLSPQLSVHGSTDTCSRIVWIPFHIHLCTQLVHDKTRDEVRRDLSASK